MLFTADLRAFSGQTQKTTATMKETKTKTMKRTMTTVKVEGAYDETSEVEGKAVVMATQSRKRIEVEDTKVSLGSPKKKEEDVLVEASTLVDRIKRRRRN